MSLSTVTLHVTGRVERENYAQVVAGLIDNLEARLTRLEANIAGERFWFSLLLTLVLSSLSPLHCRGEKLYQFLIWTLYCHMSICHVVCLRYQTKVINELHNKLWHECDWWSMHQLSYHSRLSLGAEQGKTYNAVSDLVDNLETRLTGLETSLPGEKYWL